MTRAFVVDFRRHVRPGIAVAHRGARAFAPENTLPAFARAAALGCTMVELDVHSTRDGAVVVHHDDDLRRCTNVAVAFPGRRSYAIADFSLDELLTLDAGSGYVDALKGSPAGFLSSMTDDERHAHVSAADSAHYASGDVRVPRLAEVLTLARRSGLRVNIELKPALHDDPHLAERTLSIVAAAGMLDAVLISSFDIDQLARTRTLSERIAIGLLSDASRPDVLATMAALDADALNPNVDDPHVLRDIRAAFANGRMAFPWTCNEPAAIRRLVDAGATGVITDYPNRVDPAT